MEKLAQPKGGDRRRIRKKRNKQAARVAFVTRGTAAITCQLWGHRSPRVPSTASQRAMGGSLFLFLFPPPRKKGDYRLVGTDGGSRWGPIGRPRPSSFIGNSTLRSGRCTFGARLPGLGSTFTGYPIGGLFVFAIERRSGSLVLG